MHLEDRMSALKRKLTKRFVESIKPGRKEIFVWDTDVPGFGLRVWPSGKRVYIFQYRTKHGHTRRPAIGQHGVVTADQARRIARQWAALVQEGGDPSNERRQARQAPSIRELADRYMTEHARVKKQPRSIHSDEALLRLHILPALGPKKAAAIARSDISKLHHAMRDTRGAANRVLALLSKMFNLAEKWDLRPDGSNPCRHVERYPERKLERFLSSEEMRRLGKALTEAERARTEFPSVIAAIRLLAFTGCRLSEILTLKWDHVDFEQSCIRLPESKTGAKVVRLSPPALEILNGIEPEDGSPWVIAGAKAGEHLVNLRKPWHRIRKRAGLEGVRLHDLRHSFASVGAASGLSLPMIGALLGHTQAATTQRYAHLADDPLRQASEAIGRKIAAAMKGESAEVIEAGHLKR